MIDILLTGPLRPSVEYVLDFATKLRTLFPGCRLHLCYWTTNDDDYQKCSNVFDTVIPEEEPTANFISQMITGRTTQQRQLCASVEWFTSSMFKMYYGVERVLNSLQLPPDRIVMRIRTDSYIVSSDADRLRHVIENVQPDHFYFCPRQTGGQSCDWFGISRADVLQKVYGFDSIADYNQAIRSVFNSEQIIPFNARRRNVQLVNIRDCIHLAIYRGKNTPGFPEIHEYP